MWWKQRTCISNEKACLPVTAMCVCIYVYAQSTSWYVLSSYPQAKARTRIWTDRQLSLVFIYRINSITSHRHRCNQLEWKPQLDYEDHLSSCVYHSTAFFAIRYSKISFNRDWKTSLFSTAVTYATRPRRCHIMIGWSSYLSFHSCFSCVRPALCPWGFWGVEYWPRDYGRVEEVSEA